MGGGFGVGIHNILEAAVFEIPVFNEEKDEDEIEVLVLRKLDRGTYKIIAKLMEQDDLIAAETGLKALCVHGEIDKVCKDFDALRVASNLLLEVITPKSGNVRKL